MSDSPAPDYEPKDIDPRAVMRMALWLAVALAATFVLIRVFASMLGGTDEARRREAPMADVPAPRLQASPAADLAVLRAADEARLHGYGWVDREAGIIHIPIERAMELTLERGLPAREPGKGDDR